ncbi:NAD(P)/FAD-dependent oxidoreductase [Erythrobacter sp. HL-111]|uniref:FAD-dependent oxidoreductase n=1 Tax=Erythrobacter sp. HL-111 TaxID=1798193 RepID=UPI0006DA36E9|nr:NAD(P)/FAD-dependent oxidoreductase [Erythrobacter sp. HL-111]KPP96303.1 MAG: putative oxidoreductase [Erythrobacteraceae bacterium HL-111]SDR74148.1 2-polyprenyl-6-methoxyphenol hydroxylase [Erythrobacter sp. HL-111]
MTKRSVFISGGGPAGLAAALLFDRLGWDEIVLAERRPGPSDFEKNKSFNYLVDKRSQRLFDRLGILERLPPVGVATREFTATTITPDGKARTRGVPIIDPNRPVCYWTTRRALLTMLCDAVRDLAGERVRLLYGHKVAGLTRSAAGGIAVEVEDDEGRRESFEPTLVLACDGLNSAIRQGLQNLAEVDPARFEMVATPSLSTGLRYKVLNLPSRFATRGGAAVDDPAMSYILPSRHKDRTKACALFAFPVADASHPRSVNLIREADHELWTLGTADELFAFLEDSFPQLAVRDLVGREEAEDFVGLEAGAFPAPQHARELLASFGPAGARSHVLLVGDAAHAFPPDLGLGVNSALEDVDKLADHLEAAGDLERALTAYAAERLPEARDLCWLVTHVFPEQYNHRPWAMRRWIAGFLLRRGLNAVAPQVFERPGFFLTQDPDLTYGEMRAAIERTDGRLRMAGIGSLAAGAAAALALRG